MATMLPQYFDTGRTPPGEQHVFRLLRQAPTAWTVLHQVHLAAEAGEPKTEIDFVIIAPELGVLAIEVKSHPIITYDGRGWQFGSKLSARGPFEQAEDGAKTLQRRLTKRYPGLRSASFQRCVLFPLARFGATSIAWHPWEWLDRVGFAQLSDGTALAHWITESFQQSHSMQVRAGRIPRQFPESPRPLLSGEIEAVIEWLRPRIRRQPPCELMTIRQQLLDHVSLQQTQILDQLDDNPRLLVQGPAGTGKTVLALAALRRWAGPAGRKPALVCFNHLLGAALRTSAATFDAASNVPVGTIHSFMLKCVGRSCPPRDTTAQYWLEDLPLLAMERVIDGQHGLGDVDCLIVDEAQDIICHPLYLDFLECLLGEPFPRARWLILGDFERQLFYTRQPEAETALRRMTMVEGVKCCAEIRLRHNCRNTREIGEAAELYSGWSESLYAGYLRTDGGPQDVSLHCYGSKPEMHEALHASLTSMRQAGIASNDIALLSCGPLSTEERQLLESQLGARRWSGRGNRVGYETVQRFKGLEAAGVILFNVDETAPAPLNDLMYVGCTRATMMLRILVGSSASQWLLGQVEAGLTGTTMKDS